MSGPVQSQKDPKMAISSAKRSPTTLTTNKALWWMQQHYDGCKNIKRKWEAKGVLKGSQRK
jgi:hypothetical protein